VRFLEDQFPYSSSTPIDVSGTPFDLTPVGQLDLELPSSSVPCTGQGGSCGDRGSFNPPRPAVRSAPTAPIPASASPSHDLPTVLPAHANPSHDAAPFYRLSSQQPASEQSASLGTQQQQGIVHDDREPLSNDSSDVVGRGHRISRPPAYLSDSICHSARFTPSISTTKLPSDSSGTRYPIANFVQYKNFSCGHRKLLAAVTSNVEPSTYKAAAKEERWRKAMQDEIIALERNHTWDIVDLPPGKKAIGCKRSKTILVLASI
jgi:hypothetical protein